MRQRDAAVMGAAGFGAAPRGPWRGPLACGLLLAWALVLLWSLGWVARLAPYDTLDGYRNPAEIVRLQLAFSPTRADQVIAAWRDGRTPGCSPIIACVRTDLARDWWFIMGYTLLGWVSFRALARWLEGEAGAWRRFAWVPVVAGLADTGENLALARLLDTATADPVLVGLAGVLALYKFVLLILTLMAAVTVLAFCLWARRWRQEHGPGERPPWLIEGSQVIERERVYLQSRRRRAGLPAGEDPPPVGLALSGGGIRSATLSLGVLQVFCRSGLWPRIDYLSTVSGGGYLGAALSSLLSCKTLSPGQAPDDPQQFRFGHGDTPHFGAAGPGDGPFEDRPGAVAPSAPRRWLDGRMVVAHLRAFGDFLVRRRRLLDRDVLRALGIVLTAVFVSLALFAVLMLIPAALTLALLDGLGGTAVLFPDGPRDILGALVRALADLSGPTLGLAAGLGALVAGAGAWVCGFSALQVPPDWFRRDGDTLMDARERRTLWVFGVLAVAAGLLVPGLIDPLVPGAATGLLVPAAFFGGGVLGGVLAYVLLGARFWVGVRDFKGANRSYRGAIIALFIYFTLAGMLLAGLGLLVAVLVSPEHPTLWKSLGAGVAFASAALSAGLAWWRGQSGGSNLKNVIAEVRAWYQDAAEALVRLLLGVAVALVLVLGLALALVVVAALARDLLGTASPGPLGYLGVAAVVAVVVLVLNRLIDFNTLSLHYFYRDRLSEAFLATVARPWGSGSAASPEVKRDHAELRLLDLHGRLAPAAGGAGAPPDAPTPGGAFPCHRLKATAGQRFRGRRPAVVCEPFPGAATAAPYHLFVTCLNLASERDPLYRSRKSDLFLFSRLYCGSPLTGFVDTGVYGSGEVRVARAMTISGAAVDSALGRETFFAQSFATTLFNIRLGQWLENPGYQNGRHCWRLEVGVFWPWYLLLETLGQSHTRSRLVHLSDGGHTGDNLGLIPLLERRCRLIIAVDGEQDPEYRFGSLMHAIRYVEADSGIRIRIRLDDLSPDAAGLVARHFAVGTIDYPATPAAPAATGYLLVLKSSLCAEDDATILRYRDGHPGFPHQTTADQFFAEEQFEAYRRLGQDLAEQVLAAHPELAAGSIEPPKPL